MKLLQGIICGMLCVALSSFSPAAEDPAAIQMLDHLAGNWVLQGTIANKQTTHDVQATWVLNREYLQLHEVSREKNASGGPAYEAIIYISWDAKTQEYICMWLDSTAGGGLSAEGLAHGKLAGDSIPIVFTTSPSDQIHTTFSYNKTTDTWQWVIDNVENKRTQRFATVTLTRTK